MQLESSSESTKSSATFFSCAPTVIIINFLLLLLQVFTCPLDKVPGPRALVLNHDCTRGWNVSPNLAHVYSIRRLDEDTMSTFAYVIIYT